MLSMRARESRENVLGLSIGLNKGIMGCGNTNHTRNRGLAMSNNIRWRSGG